MRRGETISDLSTHWTRWDQARRRSSREALSAGWGTLSSRKEGGCGGGGGGDKERELVGSAGAGGLAEIIHGATLPDGANAPALEPATGGSSPR